MNGFWLAAAALAAATLGVLLAPLFRRATSPLAERSAFERSILRDQLAEIDRDVERGLLDAAQAEAARIEIKRRLLAEANQGEQVLRGATSAAERRPRLLAATIATLVPISAFGIYLALGAPDAADQSFAELRADRQPTASASDSSAAMPISIDEAIARLRARLEANPQDLDGWLLLGRSYLALERYGEAAEAFRNAQELDGSRPDIAADYGEALIAAAGGGISDEARAAFRSALEGDPRNAKARYYLALDKAQQGDLEGALQDWTDLFALSPPDAPWLDMVRQQIARAAAELGVDPAAVKPSAAAEALRDR